MSETMDAADQNERNLPKCTFAMNSGNQNEHNTGGCPPKCTEGMSVADQSEQRQWAGMTKMCVIT